MQRPGRSPQAPRCRRPRIARRDGSGASVGRRRRRHSGGHPGPADLPGPGDLSPLRPVPV